MPTVAELTALYGNFMLGPRPGPGVCEICLDFTDGEARCFRCERNGAWLDVVAPISYSVAHEQLHHALAAYKRSPDRLARRFQLELAAVLWRFLGEHEPCVARAAGVPGFELVTAVPSGDRARDAWHPLHGMLATQVGPTRSRHARLLRRSELELAPREFSTRKFEATANVSGRSVLLVDDTWTTGASVRSAAAALRGAGARTVGVVVVGRHLHRDWHQNDRRLRTLAGSPFDWEHCALESAAGRCSEPRAEHR